MIPKEIREKIEKKLELDKEIRKWIDDNLYKEGLFFDSMEIVDKPTGKKQRNGDYCNQAVGHYEYEFYGYYYWLLDNEKYLRMYYEC